METGALYYGDNLDILRRYIPDASVDLVHLDPSFISNRTYNVIFNDESGRNFDAWAQRFVDGRPQLGACLRVEPVHVIRYGR